MKYDLKTYFFLACSSLTLVIFYSKTGFEVHEIEIRVKAGIVDVIALKFTTFCLLF